ncbi:MAG: WD40 repeat domain-containing protein [Planctomycetes bacterium]|nr:WD40 repeat domain-containing protein [Planctomycetota bacterium]
MKHRRIKLVMTMLVWTWASAGVGGAVDIVQILSREDPAFRAETARLAVGRDGMIYLISGGNDSYVLRLGHDGKGKFGGKVVYAANSATANSAGVVATANAHFAHKVQLYDLALQQFGESAEFLVNDQVGWDAPAHVEAGVSGDFYAIDQHRDRILRINATGKLLRAIAVPREPAGGPGQMQDFRVCEKTEAIMLLRRGGPLTCIGFDGKKRWQVNAGVNWGENVNTGGFDVDDAGNLYAIGRHDHVIKKFDAHGKPFGQIDLQTGTLKPASAEHGWSDLRLRGGEVLLKRKHPTELFQRYDLASGKLIQVVSTIHEYLAMTFPERVWTAGKKIPFSVTLQGRPAKGQPRWRVWARPVGGIGYREFSVTDGKLTVPDDCAGIYQIKVTPEIQPMQRGQRSEYGVRTWVDLRRDGAKGTATVWTEDNRNHSGRGEEIRLHVQARTGKAAQPVAAVVRLLHGKRAILEEKVTLTVKPLSMKVSAQLSAALAPGRYTIAVDAADMTCVGQEIEIGPGVHKQALHRIQYGDYGPTYPAADLWEAPDLAAAHVERTRKLGMNLMVDRLGDPNQGGAFLPDGASRGDMEEIVKHLEKDPLAPAPQRYQPVATLRQVLSGYSAAGIEQMSILMMNDAGLPLGTGFDPRKPPQLLETIERVTEAARPYPAFRGWSWASNWWIFDKRGANGARTAAEKAAYETAWKEARKSGAWDPVLDAVSSHRFSFAVEAQELFNKKLRVTAPKLVTASACPHRNVESYPPVTFSNVDEVDLQAQWEQIGMPLHVPHGVDFYRRPGKRAWTHPEIWNDSGTGGQVLPTLFQALMRGADGVGCSGPIPPWTSGGTLPDDPRGGHYGTTSVFRAFNDVARRYGPWLATLRNNDKVAIVVSGRQLRIDDWPIVMGTHFARLFEAYAACLHAHHPASYVFVEDLKPGLLKRYKAVLVVGQTVAMEPELREALVAARKHGVAILHDGTCRPELVKDFQPLGVSFNQFEKDPSPAADDAAYLRFPAYCLAHVAQMKKALDPVVGPTATTDNPEVFISERTNGAARFLFVVNNTTPALEPGHLWRITLAVANRVPVIAKVKLPKHDGVIYDVFAGNRIEPRDGVIDADLRSLPCRIYALLPAAIDGVDLTAPKAVSAGQPLSWSVHLRSDADSLGTALPQRIRLLDSNGKVLRESFTTATGEWSKDSLTIPIGTPAGDLILEATELVSGQRARLTVEVTAVNLPFTFATRFLGDPRVQKTSDAVTRSQSNIAADDRFGSHLRDVVITDHGRTAVMNAMNWDHNLHAVDVATGKLRWRQRAGQYFAFAPQALPGGFAVKGFDFQSAEGYHLYLGNAAGKLERRFALYGLPRRQIQRFIPGMFMERINNFAVAPDGSWIAAAGDLGLAVWSRDGKRLWSEDWWKTRRHTATLAALDTRTVLAVDDTTASARDAVTGKQLWQVRLAATGEARDIRVSMDGKTCALYATTEGGRVFVLRDGKVAATIPTAANGIDLSADGRLIAVVDRNHLKLYSVTDGLQWLLQGDDTLHQPRISPDGKRVAVGSALGTVYVVAVDGTILLDRDMKALSVPAWLPDGDLLLAGWMGTVCRLDGKYAEKWRTHLQPAEIDMRGKLLAAETVPTTRIASWGNAEAKPWPLAPNLLGPKDTYIRFQSAMGHMHFVHPVAELVDGKPTPPKTPWLHWHDVGHAAEISPINSIVLDTFRTQLRVTAVTLVEDRAHPESWLRDVALETWDPTREQWRPVQTLLSDAAVHTHKLASPIEASRFRLVLPRGMCGNIRLGEIVFHGDKIGPNHPDVIAKRPVAVLFDEGDELKSALVSQQLSFKFAGAFSGGRYLALAKDAQVYPPFLPPFGHALPGWDFEIAEKPGPGQYRYLEFAWKAGSPDTKGITLQIGSMVYGQQVGIHCGAYKKTDGVKPLKAAAVPPSDWQTVRVDLWDVFRRDFRVQAMTLLTQGGEAALDRIVLKRE